MDWAPDLEDKHTRNARLFPSRYSLMRALTKEQSVGAEVGVQTGRFSQFILSEINPLLLHLIDINLDQILYEECALIQPAVGSKQVRLHSGHSLEVLKNFNDASLDWIYVDADHDYAGVRADLAQATRVVFPGGLVICNDYTQWSPIEGKPYGVQRAVNELCLAQGWEIAALGLHGAGYHDVALRKMP